MIVRLDAFLREFRVDPSLRRRLHSQAPSAFAERGFAEADLPTALPPSRNADVLLTHGQLFGVAPAEPLTEPCLELRLLAYGLKPLVLVHGLKAELQATMAWAESRGFTALLSAHEWDRGTDDGKGGYSNLATGMRSARSGAGVWRSILVGANEDRVILGWIALTLGWDEMLGRLLGYPACCAKAFARRWRRAVESHQGDMVVYCIDDSGAGPHDWRVNNLGRYFGAELIQHFACQFGCQASLAMAHRADAALAAWEPDLHEWTRGVLEAPVVYTELSGVAVLRGAEVVAEGSGQRVRYNADRLLVTEPDGALHAALRGATTVAVLPGRRELAIGDDTVAARLVVFAEP